MVPKPYTKGVLNLIHLIQLIIKGGSNKNFLFPPSHICLLFAKRKPKSKSVIVFPLCFQFLTALLPGGECFLKIVPMVFHSTTEGKVTP